MNMPLILHSILLNLIIFFTLESYTEFYAKTYHQETKIKLRKTFITFNVIYSFISGIPIIAGYAISCISDIIYIKLTTHGNIKNNWKLFVKYWIFSYTFSFIIYMLHSFLTMDWIYSIENPLYNSYKEVLNYFLIYVSLSVYINLKTYMYDQKEAKTIRMFNILILSISLIISIIPLVLRLETEDSQNLLIMTFSLLMVLILFILSLHKKLLLIMDENLKTKVELETNKLKEEYSEKLEEYTEHLRRLRHDMKNHIIIIDGYARQNDTAEIITYMNRMWAELYYDDTITTPSPAISSILNSKAALCRQQRTEFSLEQDFNRLCISDFDISIILGNILDNAIRAAAECEHGKILLKLQQKNSYLEIYCENTYIGKLLEHNQTLQSTKPEAGHGLGISNIQQSVEKLNGTMTISHDDSLFQVTIRIPNYT